MKARLLIARGLFVVAAVVLAGGSAVIFRSGTAHGRLGAEENELASKREAVRAKLVESKVNARAFSKSIAQMPDSVRSEQSGEISATLSNYNKEAIVLTNDERALSLSLGDIKKKRSALGARLRREIIAVGSGALLALLVGGWLLLSARSAFRT